MKYMISLIGMEGNYTALWNNCRDFSANLFDYLSLKNFEGPLMKVINLLASLLFLSACTGRVSPEKIAGLNFYIDNQFVYEPILTVDSRMNI